jgi:hypothetical protein
MRAQRRFKLAYPRSRASTAIRRLDSISGRKKIQRSASRTPIANWDGSGQELDVLLDEDFDDLPCEPRILLQLANQR